jgi:hypothetical protein
VTDWPFLVPQVAAYAFPESFSPGGLSGSQRKCKRMVYGDQGFNGGLLDLLGDLIGGGQ